MSERIGRIDSTKEILAFLRIYNKSKGKTMKIQKDALIRLDKFINIFMKILISNCVEMLRSLKLLTLTSQIFYTVYDIMINGDQEFTKNNFDRFQNTLVKAQIEQSQLTFDNKKTLNTNIFDLSAKILAHKVLGFYDITTNPRVTGIEGRVRSFGQLIEFILIFIFEDCKDCDTITTDFLSNTANREELVKLDNCFGSFGILKIDKIEMENKSDYIESS